MNINFGREVCGNLAVAQEREWLVTNGLGSYASGTVAGVLTRCYHGLLVAALKPPLARSLLVTKIDETIQYDGHHHRLFVNRWADDIVDPNGYWYLESFHLEGTIPVWRFAVGDALLEKRIWMAAEANITYVYYQLVRGSQPLVLSFKVLVNYRDYHTRTKDNSWRMAVLRRENGMGVTAFPGAVPFYLLANRGEATIAHNWYNNFQLVAEGDRGLFDLDDNLYVGTFQATIAPAGNLTFVASTEVNPSLEGAIALPQRRAYEQELIQRANWQSAPAWINQLVLAADQFIVNRPLPDQPEGKTILAGYHWFADWGRDTMIALPGLTLATNRPEIAAAILRTFGKYVNQGMLPNNFPDDGRQPDEGSYNTVDATLWYFEALRQYYDATGDRQLLVELFPILAEIINWHVRGTRYNIHQDSQDGLIYAGKIGTQLTWMDAKVDEWVVTPRMGKPVEISALWYNALKTMVLFAEKLGKPSLEYQAMAEVTLKGFQRFWNADKGYCFDVLDTPTGNDTSLRPNQIFAVSLSESPLTPSQQQQVVEICGRYLLTSYGLRSLAPGEAEYQGKYEGDRISRDGAYHQGTVWGWLIGAFAIAHWRVFKNPVQARTFLEPMAQHLQNAGLGTISEIFNGDAPIQPKGCIAQAWSVAEVLRAWRILED